VGEFDHADVVVGEVVGAHRFFIPDAEGAEVAQKAQKRMKKLEMKVAASLCIKASPFESSASSAQLLRLLRPVFISYTF
jgi:hypothetical protein